MAPIRHKLQLRGTATTKPDSILKKHIPYKTNQSNEKEQDLLKPIQLHIVAVWGKGEKGVINAIKSMEHNFPFPLKGFMIQNF